MKTTWFDFYGVKLKIGYSTLAQTNIQAITEDFYFFACEETSSIRPDIQVSVFRNPKRSGFRIPFFQTKMCQVYSSNRYRLCEYPDDHFIKIRKSKGMIRTFVMGTDDNLVYEILFSLVLSLVGEALDKRGLHRLHSLTYWQSQRSYSYVLPSGGGKSTMAMQLLRNDDALLLSDEITLTDGETFYAFPIRIALKQKPDGDVPFRKFQKKIFGHKWLVKIPLNKIRSSTLPEKVFVQTPDFFNFPKIYFFLSLVLGLGVPQMAEFFVRGDNIKTNMRILFSRFIAAMKLLKIVNVTKYPQFGFSKNLNNQPAKSIEL